MLAALQSRSPSLSTATSSLLANRSWKLGFCTSNPISSSPSADSADKLLNLQDIEKVLHDTKADNVFWIPLESDNPLIEQHHRDQEFLIVSEDRVTNRKPARDKDVLEEVLKTHEAIKTLDKSVAMLQMKMAARQSDRESKHLS